MRGYLGCSNTVDAWKQFPGDRWPALKYGYGEVHQWAAQGDGGKLWAALDGALALYGEPDAVWWQICVHTNYAASAITDAETVLPRLRARYSGPIFISAINGTDPDGLCPSVDARAAQAAADWLLAGEPPGLAAGPPMPALTADQLVAPDYVHPNRQGSKLLGAALTAFFG